VIDFRAWRSIFRQTSRILLFVYYKSYVLCIYIYVCMYIYPSVVFRQSTFKIAQKYFVQNVEVNFSSC